MQFQFAEEERAGWLAMGWQDAKMRKLQQALTITMVSLEGEGTKVSELSEERLPAISPQCHPCEELVRPCRTHRG